MSPRDEPKARLREWIAARNPKLAIDELREDTPLIRGGVLTSLQVVELLGFIEELRGEPLDLDELTPGAFRDLATICEAFFGERRS